MIDNYSWCAGEPTGVQGGEVKLFDLILEAVMRKCAATPCQTQSGGTAVLTSFSCF